LSILSVLAGGLVLPSSVAAQSPEVGLPQPDVRLPQQQLYEPTRPAQQVGVPESAPTRAPAGAENVRFILSGLEIQGRTAYPPQVIEAIYEKRIGTEVSLADVYGIAEEIQRFYRKDGYFLARAILPAQTAQEGRLRIQVFEGFISDVLVEGDIGPVGDLVKKYLQHLPSDRPLKLKTLERCLLLANDIPGVEVKGTLRPATEQVGAAQLVASVERRAFGAAGVVDNYGSSFTGVWQTAATVSGNSFTSWGDGWNLGGLVSGPFYTGDDDYQYAGQVRGSIRPWSNGAYLSTLVFYGRSNPGGAIALFDSINKQLQWSTIGGYPIIRSRDRNLFTELGFDLINGDTDIFSDIPFSRDKLRVLHLTAFGDFQDAWRGFNFLSFGVRQGLPIFDASESGDEQLSRLVGTGVFTSLNAKLSRLQPIYGPVALFCKAAGQYSFNNLLIEEQFGVGSTQFGRGYNPNELSSDQGVGVTGELQYTRPMELSYLDRFQVFGFYDFGQVWDRDTDNGTSLSSAGGGLRAWFTRNISMELAVAQPLTRNSLRGDDTKDPQVLFQAAAQF
jgi:hemolysin activation/secretion protein